MPSAQENIGSEDDQASLKSPEPVSLQLNVPSEGDSSSQGKAVRLNLDINDETLLPSWKDHSPASDDESMVGLELHDSPCPAICKLKGRIFTYARKEHQPYLLLRALPLLRKYTHMTVTSYHLLQDEFLIIPFLQAHDADTNAGTDCTDYSGLGDAVPDNNKSLNDVLTEVNQRHEWAMEVRICSAHTHK